MHSVSYVYSDSFLEEGNIKLDYQNIFRPNIASGQYTINGTIFGRVPISGSGSVNSSVDSSFDVQFIEFHGFEVVDDHIDLSKATHGSGVVHPMGFLLDFEGLEAGGYEDEIMSLVVRSSYSPAINPLVVPIMQSHMRMYLEEVFEATPVSEIVGNFTGRS